MNTTKASPQGTNRKTAAVVGVLFIIGTVAGVLSCLFMRGLLDAPDLLNMVAANASQVGLEPSSCWSWASHLPWFRR